jgi:hypothetical protein
VCCLHVIKLVSPRWEPAKQFDWAPVSSPAVMR